MRCPNCRNETEVLLIDCSLPFGKRDGLRYCYSCRPQHPYAGCLPRVIVVSSLSEKEKRKALAARRYVVDRLQSYPMAERLADLAGGID